MPADKPTGQPGPLRHDEFKGASIANLVSFSITDIEPPTSLYIQRDDTLLWAVQSNNNAAADTFMITVRLWLAAEGRITTIQQSLASAPGGVPQLLPITLAEGFLLSVVVTSSGTSPFNKFTVVVLNRGPVVFPPTGPAGLLICAYVSGNFPVGWPGGRIDKSYDGAGTLSSVPVTNPAAGADWVAAVPTNNTWEVVCLVATLTTSATAGSRAISLLVDDGANVFFEATLGANVIANSTQIISAWQGAALQTVLVAGAPIALPPRNLLPPGWRVRSSTAGIQVGDQWSAIRLFARAWVGF